MAARHLQPSRLRSAVANILRAIVIVVGLSSPGSSEAMEPIAATVADVRAILQAESQAIVGAKGKPVFLSDGERFLYQTNGRGGLSVDLVDPRRHLVGRLAVAEDLHRAFLALKLDGTLALVEGLSEDGGVVYFTVGEKSVAYDRASKTARIDPERALWVELHRPRLISDQYPTTYGDLVEAPSPDGRRFITQKADNLWVRDVDGQERQLTSDGNRDLTWGGTQESAQQFNVFWSPDGKRIATLLLDNRATPHEPVMHYLSGKATVTTWPFPRAGDPISRFSLYVIDPDTGGRVKLDAGDTDDRYVDVLGWSADARSVYYQVVDREQKVVEFHRADAATGASHTVAIERSDTYIDTPFTLGPPLLTPLVGSDRFLLLSERDRQWRRLYLYDGAGHLLRSLGGDLGLVSSIVRVDEAHGRVFVLASTSADRPYDVALYNVPLDGGPATRLTPGPGIREVWPAPNGEAFVVRTADSLTPPTVEVLNPQGRKLAMVSRADVSGLKALGFTEPEAFVTVATDGHLDVRGLILKPFGFDSSRRYPVVEMVYGGMQVSNTPKSFYGFGKLSSGYNSVPARVLLHHGFVVVYVDAPGTPDRGRKYQDATYGIWPQTVIGNHAKWIRDAARTRPWMDLTRVGIFGNSWGGHMSQRALVDAPDLYKVAVAMTASADPNHSMYSEPFMGMPQHNPQGYEAGSIYSRLRDMRGRILVIGFPEDVNAGFEPTMKYVHALVAEQKDFDMLVLPGINHHINCCGEPTESYGYAVITRYFRRWLGGEPD
jgi:dipeptidyl-peptidase-4